MKKNVLKFSGGILALLMFGFGVLYTIDRVQYRRSPEYRARLDAEKIKKEYAEDPYGGDTPEETLRLFVDALKKEDTQLAAKYFVLDKQDEWREDLSKIKEKGLLDAMVRDVQKLGNKYPLREEDNKKFIFEAFNDQKELVMQAELTKELNRKWKIRKL